MSFEEIIKKLSAIIASVVVFFLAAGFYLSAKGFVMIDGVPVLVKNARANTDEKVKIEANVVLPEGRVLGQNDAPIAIYEFSSFGCYHCAGFHLDTLNDVKKDFIDTGHLKLVFIPFPLEAKSMQGALIAECIDKDKYFDFINLLFKKQREWGLSNNAAKTIKQYAVLNGLDEEKAEACLHNNDVAREIISMRQLAMERFKIQGTPSFMIVTPDERFMHYGAMSYDEIKQIIQDNLETQAEENTKK